MSKFLVETIKLGLGAVGIRIHFLPVNVVLPEEDAISLAKDILTQVGLETASESKETANPPKFRAMVRFAPGCKPWLPDPSNDYMPATIYTCPDGRWDVRWDHGFSAKHRAANFETKSMTLASPHAQAIGIIPDGGLSIRLFNDGSWHVEE